MVKTEEDSNAKKFKKEELDALNKEGKDKKKSGEKSEKSSKDDEDMTPQRMNPKEDYQVKQALISLKSFDVYKKNSVPEKEGTPKPLGSIMINAEEGKATQ